MKWRAKYNELLATTSHCDKLQLLPEPQQYGYMIHVQTLLVELERLARLHDQFVRERAFMATLNPGVAHSMKAGKPAVAALWLQDKLMSESEEGNMVDRAKLVKELSNVNKFLGNDKLNGTAGASWSGPSMQPTMLAPHFGGFGGMSAFGSSPAFGGFGGFRGPPAWAPGPARHSLQFHQGVQGHYTPRGQGGGGGGGGGGRRTPKCSKCRDAGLGGQAIMYSHRHCPNTKCHKCGKKGHNQMDCRG